MSYGSFCFYICSRSIYIKFRYSLNIVLTYVSSQAPSSDSNHGPEKGSNNPKLRNLQLGGHVGFDSLPDQLVNQSVAAGFTFNIMSIGK